MRVAGVFFRQTQPESILPFAESCLRFSPQICVQRPGAIFIEIGKCKTLYSEENFIRRIQILLKRFQLQADVKIANSILETILLKEYSTLDPDRLPTQSFVEIFDPFQTKVDSIKEIKKMISQLEQVGITTVSSFLKLPSGDLAIRFGKTALWIRHSFLEELDPGWPLWVPPEKICEHLELFDSDRCQDIEPILFYLKGALDRLFTRLWGRGLRASSLSLKLNLEKYSTVRTPLREWKFEFILPQSTARGTLPILRERLDRDLSRKPLESFVLSMDLEIIQSVRDYQGQKHFFHSKEDIEENFNSAISQLAEGLGKDKVFRAHLKDEAVPEKSWIRSFKTQTELPELDGYIPKRPNRLLKRPELVQMAKDMIFIRKRGYRITRWSSVEQIATHWLDEEVVRSYYRIELEGKSPVWVFKSPQDEYFLHGWFG